MEKRLLFAVVLPINLGNVIICLCITMDEVPHDKILFQVMFLSFVVVILFILECDLPGTSVHAWVLKLLHCLRLEIVKSACG